MVLVWCAMLGSTVNTVHSSVCGTLGIISHIFYVKVDSGSWVRFSSLVRCLGVAFGVQEIGVSLGDGLRKVVTYTAWFDSGYVTMCVYSQAVRTVFLIST